MTAVKLWEAWDVDPVALRDKTVAIIGFGSQGHAHALNLQDSGVTVIVGLRDGSPSAVRARGAGLAVESVAQAARRADVVALLIPDPAQPDVYRREVAPHLRPGRSLLFAHGFNVHYQQISPPDEVDVIMVAPKAPGAMLRREYEAGRGVPALIAVHRDASGAGHDTALAYAHALGCTRAGVLGTTFAHETETDLFGEQAVLCGGVSALIKAGFETLVEAGYAPELAYFECLHELKLIVDLIQAGGLSGMRQGVSDTAEFGDYVAGERVIDGPSRDAMRQLLAEIRRGEFAKRWIADGAAGGSELRRLRAAEARHPLEQVGRQLRARMSWLAEPAAAEA